LAKAVGRLAVSPRPPLWQRTLDLLAQQGTRVEESRLPTPPARTGTDLAAVRGARAKDDR
jgi:hypothetical protein